VENITELKKQETLAFNEIISNVAITASNCCIVFPQYVVYNLLKCAHVANKTILLVLKTIKQAVWHILA